MANIQGMSFHAGDAAGRNRPHGDSGGGGQDNNWSLPQTHLDWDDCRLHSGVHSVAVSHGTSRRHLEPGLFQVSHDQ